MASMHAEHKMNDETGGRNRHRRIRPSDKPVRPRATRGQAGWLTVLVAAAALALAACSGGGGTPQVASLGTSSGPEASSGLGSTGGTGGGSSPATAPGGVTALLNEWGACERSNGDPQQTDPTVDASGVIHITIPQRAQPTGDIHELTGTCSQYLAQAQNKLRAANPVPPAPDQAEYLKYVGCMRANGVPNYPYPTGDTTNFQGSGVDPDSPLVVRVSQLCGQKLGLPAWWVNGTSTPGSIEVHTAGMPVSPTAPACLFQKVDPCRGDVTKSAGSGGQAAGAGPGDNG
jgi:hypothetical protein